MYLRRDSSMVALSKRNEIWTIDGDGNVIVMGVFVPTVAL